MTTQILPGATLGVLGSGQLGRMFAIAARRLGYRVHVYSPDSDSPTGQVADREFSAAYDDLDSLAEFARSVDVVTFEFENVPSSVTDCIEQFAPVRPSGAVLAVAQHRLTEKSTLRNAGLPVPDFLAVATIDDLNAAVAELGTPCVLKTSSSGYDGKGQRLLRSPDETADAWAELNTDDAILEAFVDFDCEVSVVAARNESGEFAAYSPFLNTHANHILDVTLCPSGLGSEIESAAIEVARTVFETLDVLGVLCVEMFVTKSGGILINELAPRPHNSGHLTIDAHVTCQFEQQVRAICNLPLGSTTQHGPAAMANLLGDLWSHGEPDWSSLLSLPDAKLHLYGKSEARPGRKMGHISAVATDLHAAEQLVRNARSRL